MNVGAKSLATLRKGTAAAKSTLVAAARVLRFGDCVPGSFR